MKEIEVGEIITVYYDTETEDMKIIISVKDLEFKKNILKNSKLSNKIKIKDSNVYLVKEE